MKSQYQFFRRGSSLRDLAGYPHRRYEHFSYSDLLEGRLKEKIRGRFVIMGFNATGLSDYFFTGKSNRYPGSEIHAAALDHLLGALSASAAR